MYPKQISLPNYWELHKLKNSDKNNWYVYKHIRKDKNEPFYIGIGCKSNYFRAHEGGNKRNVIWNKISNKTEWEVEIISEGLDKKSASLKEQELIKIYGRLDNNTGILSNMTDGGDGIWNCKRSEKTRKILSQQKMGSKNPMYGKKQSQDFIEKRIKNIRGSRKSEITKLRQSLSSIKSGQAKSVNVYKYDTNEFIGTFHSTSFAAKSLGFSGRNTHAFAVLKGKRKQVNGYVFRYTDDVSNTSRNITHSLDKVNS